MNYKKAYYFCILIAIFATQANNTQALEPAILSPILSNLVGNSPVNSIHEDRFGFLWIGTQSGIYRYDGERSFLYSNNPRSDGYLPVTDIRGLTEDYLGRIVAATFGASCF